MKGKTMVVSMYNCKCSKSVLLDSAMITNYSINAAGAGDQKLITSDCISLQAQEGIVVNYITEYGFLSVRTIPDEKFVIAIITSFNSAKLDNVVKFLAAKFLPEKFKLSESNLITEAIKAEEIKEKIFKKSGNKGDYTIDKDKSKKKTAKKKKTTKKKSKKPKTEEISVAPEETSENPSEE